MVEFVIRLFKSYPVRSILVFTWLVLVLLQPQLPQLLESYAGFSLLGVVGAIFANATGAGGGVVFVPFFNHMGFAAGQIVATSFAIQCCGMTAGAITWWRYYRTEHSSHEQWGIVLPTLGWCVPASILGIWSAQYGANWLPFLAHLQGNMDQLHIGFGLFSIVLALAIFASIKLLDKPRYETTLLNADRMLLVATGYIGGAITAWLSVGVGELVAVYLIIRGFNVTAAIAIAVILTCFSVWSAIPYHAFITADVVWQVVLFAGAGAIVGGIIAKRVVLAFRATHLKFFFAIWVLIMGVSGLV